MGKKLESTFNIYGDCYEIQILMSVFIYQKLWDSLPLTKIFFA